MRIVARVLLATALFGAGALSAVFIGMLGPAPPVAPPAAAASSDTLRQIEDAYQGKNQPEDVRMLLALTNRERIKDGNGWFGPGRAVRSWNWLAKRHGIEPGGAIPPDRFTGSPERFKSIDRDSDGRLSQTDFDWRNGGRPEEPQREPVSIHEALLAGPSRPDLPPAPALLRSFFAGDLGSLTQGPEPGDVAPDFTLRTDDGSSEIRLRDLIGRQPVVLVFGSITCDSFRGRFAEVNEVRDRFKDDAKFLFVYVREAHPADGWVKQVNALNGISVKQPKTLDARAEVAHDCRESLRPAMPIVVDGISDPTADAYAALPARLYVIDRDGRVAFKSGRGPVGFYPREMEQALALTLLDETLPAEATATPPE